MQNSKAQTAILYRMATAQSICPSGLKARDLLMSRGFSVEERLLRDRAVVDTFKAEYDVATTPQVFINGQRVGGFTDLQDHFGIARPDPTAKSYTPVLWIFDILLIEFLMMLKRVRI